MQLYVIHMEVLYTAHVEGSSKPLPFQTITEVYVGDTGKETALVRFPRFIEALKEYCQDRNVAGHADLFEPEISETGKVLLYPREGTEHIKRVKIKM
ncbi:MAG TPA: hypothetical protein VE439_10920 [Anaerolineae bacterium]|nr:hypothetical protein [Anaerolineae bacterium]